MIFGEFFKGPYPARSGWSVITTVAEPLLAQLDEFDMGSDHEVLNWTYWGLRAADITSLVSATYGPIPMEYVVEYLKAAEDAGVVTRSYK